MIFLRKKARIISQNLSVSFAVTVIPNLNLTEPNKQNTTNHLNLKSKIKKHALLLPKPYFPYMLSHFSQNNWSGLVCHPINVLDHDKQPITQNNSA